MTPSAPSPMLEDMEEGTMAAPRRKKVVAKKVVSARKTAAKVSASHKASSVKKTTAKPPAPPAKKPASKSPASAKGEVAQEMDALSLFVRTYARF